VEAGRVKFTHIPVLMLAAIGLWLFAEGAGVASPAKGDTFSEIWWWLRDERVTRFAMWALWAWASYHLMLQGRGAPRHGGWRDFTAMGVGLVIGIAEVLLGRKSW
jgi:hypothetical protein